MKNFDFNSTLKFKMVENNEYAQSLLESAYPKEKYVNELYRNVQIYNAKILRINSYYIEVFISFQNPEVISVGGEQYFDKLLVHIRDQTRIIFERIDNTKNDTVEIPYLPEMSTEKRELKEDKIQHIKSISIPRQINKKNEFDVFYT